MQVGILTSPFGKEPFEKVIQFAGENGFDALEVASGVGGGHIDVATLDSAKAAEIKAALSKYDGLRISSLAMYMNVTDPEKREQTIGALKQGVDAAAKLGVGVVCTLAGMPVPGKDKMKTIEEDCPLVLKPVAQYAAGKGIKIAMENWYATNIQHLGHWRRIFEVIPDALLGDLPLCQGKGDGIGPFPSADHRARHLRLLAPNRVTHEEDLIFVRSYDVR